MQGSPDVAYRSFLSKLSRSERHSLILSEWCPGAGGSPPLHSPVTESVAYLRYRGDRGHSTTVLAVHTAATINRIGMHPRDLLTRGADDRYRTPVDPAVLTVVYAPIIPGISPFHGRSFRDDGDLYLIEERPITLDSVNRIIRLHYTHAE